MAVEKFCCCGSLRAGAVTAAALNALAVAGFFITCFTGFANYSNYSSKGLDKLAHASLYEAIKTLVQGIIGTIVLVFLCLGIHRRIANYILPWLVFTALAIFFWIIVFILSVLGIGVVASSHGGKAEDAWIVLVVFGLVLLAVIGFMIHLFLVVLAFYRILKAEQQQAISAPIAMTGPAYVVNPAPVYYPPSDNKGPVPQITVGGAYPKQQYQPSGYSNV